MTVRDETVDVGVGVRGENEADRRDEVRGQAPAAQHEVDQRTANPTVAVGERVDRLELGVGYRGLHERGMRIGGQVLAEVLEQTADIAGWRRDELGDTRVDAADPVLLIPDDTAEVRVAGTREQRPMQPTQVVDGHRTGFVGQFERTAHCRDVAEDRPGSVVVGRQSGLLGERLLGEATSVDLQPLDVGGAHGLGPKQEPGYGLDARQPEVPVLQGGHGPFSVGEVGDEIRRQQQLPAR